MTTATTFVPTVAEATAAGFFPSRHEVEVVDNQELTDGVYRLTFRDEYIASHAKPAQFVDVYSNDPSKLMPRPFGVCETNGDEVSLMFAVVGKGTAEFAGLKAGDTIRVMGPLGNSFKTKEPANYVLVAGGLGVPPLVHAAQHIAGIEGELMDSGLKPVILTCGPLPMMKAVAAWAVKRDMACQLSLEQRMGCGYGTCVLCTVDTLDGRLKVCSDGPVFTRERLGWGE